jgi:hypothetical protein
MNFDSVCSIKLAQIIVYTVGYITIIKVEIYYWYIKET